MEAHRADAGVPTRGVETPAAVASIRAAERCIARRGRLLTWLCSATVETGDWITVTLTGALVAITAYYAWQNRRMVAEMAAARALTVLPKLALRWHAAAPMITFPEVINVGSGAALDVDIELVFVPKNGSGAKEDRRRWQTNLLASGERHHFLTLDPSDRSILQTDKLAAMYGRIELGGTAHDVLGASHEVRDVLEDVAAWRDLQAAASVHWQHPDPERRLAVALAKEFKEPLTHAAASLRQAASALRAAPAAARSATRVSGEAHAGIRARARTWLSRRIP